MTSEPLIVDAEKLVRGRIDGLVEHNGYSDVRVTFPVSSTTLDRIADALERIATTLEADS